MKKFIVILTSLLVGLCAFSQEGTYKKMLVNGRTWHGVIIEGNHQDTTSYWHLTLEGPVEFQGYQCFKTNTGTYLYESGHKVYEYSYNYKPEGEWLLSFDFDAVAGTRIYLSADGEEYNIVLSSDSVEIGNTKRKRMQYYVSARDEYFIEGIGSTETGPSIMKERPTCPCWSKVLSVYDGEECIFSEDDLKDVTYIRNVEHLEGQKEHVYDLKGLPVEAPLQKGIYIKKGKKYVVWQ